MWTEAIDVYSASTWRLLPLHNGSNVNFTCHLNLAQKSKIRRNLPPISLRDSLACCPKCDIISHSELKHDRFNTLQYRICGTTELNLQPYWFASLNLAILCTYSNFERWVYQKPSQFLNEQFEFKHKNNNGNTKFITFKVSSQQRPFKGCVWHIYCSDNDYWLNLLVNANLVTASHLQPAVSPR